MAPDDSVGVGEGAGVGDFASGLVAKAEVTSGEEEVEFPAKSGFGLMVVSKDETVRSYCCGAVGSPNRLPYLRSDVSHSAFAEGSFKQLERRVGSHLGRIQNSLGHGVDRWSMIVQKDPQRRLQLCTLGRDFIH